MKFLNDLSTNLPPIIARSRIDEFLPGVISPKTLANLANKGLGPRFFKSGRHALYRTADLLRWLEDRAEPYSTAEQAWDEDDRAS